MKAIVITATGGPEVLELRELPPPRPGPGEVVVDTEAIPVLFVETQLRAGVLPGAAMSGVFGAQAAGVVSDIGDGVDRTLIGRRVLVSGQGIGTYAEKVCAGVAAIVPIPDGVSASGAAAATMGGSVALALANRAASGAADTVLIEAAGTGIGNYLTQILRRRGVGRILATAGSAANRASARAAGADEVFDHRSDEWPADLGAVLGDDTIDVVFDSIGGDTTRGLTALLTPLSGRILFYGLLSGRPPQLSPADLMGGGTSITACAGPAWLGAVHAAAHEALAMIADGTLVPRIDSVLPLDDAAEAHRRIENRTATGTFILRPTQV